MPLFAILGYDVDRSLPAGIARIGRNFETDALPDLQHLETAFRNGRMMKKQLVARISTVRGNEPEAPIAQCSNRPCRHDCSLPYSIGAAFQRDVARCDPITGIINA